MTKDGKKLKLLIILVLWALPSAFTFELGFQRGLHLSKTKAKAAAEHDLAGLPRERRQAIVSRWNR